MTKRKNKNLSPKQVADIRAKAEALKNCRMIDFWVFGDHAYATQFVDHIWFQMLGENPNYQLKRKDGVITLLGYQLRDAIMPVMLDLYSLWSQNPTGYLAFTLRKGDYTNTRYHPSAVSYRVFKRVFEFLLDNDYIEYHKGYKTKEGNGHYSKMRATEKTVALFKMFKLVPSILKRHENEEVVILKDGNKLKDYRDTWDTMAMREFLRQYNMKLDKVVVDHNFSDKDYNSLPPQVDLYNKHIKRVFSRNDWKKGGRFYSKCWTNLNKKLRKKLTINGQQIAELDYTALHPTILYLKAGATVPTGDMYKVDGYPTDGVSRKFIKTLTNTMINAEDEVSAMKAMQEALNKPVRHRDGTISSKMEIPSWLKDTSYKSLQLVIEAVRKQHKPINKYFLSDEGVNLQYIDSEIAQRILVYFLTRDVVLLPEHDSFMIQANKRDELKQVMVEVFQIVMETDYVIGIEQKY